MNQMKNIGLLLLVLLLAAFTILKLYQLNETPAASAQIGIPVTTAPVEKGPFSSSIEYAGIIEPAFSSSLTSEITAPIAQTLVNEGQYVYKGDLLFILNPDRYMSKLALTEKKAESAAKTESYLKNELERLEILYKENAVSEKEFTDLTYKYDMAALGLEEANTTLKEARQDIERTKIYAPFNGYITKIFKYPGDMTVSGQPLLNIESVDEMVVSVNTTQSDLLVLKPGNRTLITVDDSKTTARVTKIDKTINRQNRSARLEIALTKKQIEELKGYSGMSVKVNFITGEKSNALLVPRRAILTEKGRSYVFMAKQSVAQKQPIKTGLTNDEYIEVQSGLTENQKVIVSGLSKLYDNCPIYIYEGEEDSN